MWVYRQICQEVCPRNQRFAEVAAERGYAARRTTDGPSLVALMRMSEAEWDAYTRGPAMRPAGYQGLRRDVAIAIRNWLAGSDSPDPDAVGELLSALSDEDEGVARAAAWALGRPVRPGGGPRRTRGG